MPASLEGVVVIGLFLLPGFIAAVAYDRNSPRREVSDFRFLLQVVFWGALIHLLALPMTGEYFLAALRDSRSLLAVTTSGDLFRAGLVLLALPSVVGAFAGWFLARRWVQKILGLLGMSSLDLVPTAWDSAFKPGGKGAWVYVYLRGLADPIIGRYGKNSVAGISPSPHDLYLEERWRKEDGKLELWPSTAGVWISADEIEFVELYRNSGE